MVVSVVSSPGIALAPEQEDVNESGNYGSF
jgi:hypothetical protein